MLKWFYSIGIGVSLCLVAYMNEYTIFIATLLLEKEPKQYFIKSLSKNISTEREGFLSKFEWRACLFEKNLLTVL
jgi:hypothetical protein